MSFAKLILHACCGDDFSFCIKKSPIETNAQGVAAAAKKEITCANGSYKTKSVDAHTKPAIGATNNGLVHKDLNTPQAISWDFLWDCMPTSMRAVAIANITKTIKVAMMAGARPS